MSVDQPNPGKRMERGVDPQGIDSAELRTIRIVETLSIGFEAEEQGQVDAFRRALREFLSGVTVVRIIGMKDSRTDAVQV